MMMNAENLTIKIDAKGSNVSLSEPLKIDVASCASCARCGGDHQKLDFRRLARPSGEHTHWARCPYLGEPVMLKIL